MFFKLSGPFSQNVHFWRCDIFSRVVLIQSTQFFTGKVDVFDESFFHLTIRMPILSSNLPRCLTYCETFLPINLHDTSMGWSFEVAWQVKYMSPLKWSLINGRWLRVSKVSWKVVRRWNFAKLTGKHLRQSPFFNKVVSLRPTTLLKKRLWHRCFPREFCESSQNTFYYRIPLVIASNNIISIE